MQLLRTLHPLEIWNRCTLQTTKLTHTCMHTPCMWSKVSARKSKERYTCQAIAFLFQFPLSFNTLILSSFCLLLACYHASVSVKKTNRVFPAPAEGQKRSCRSEVSCHAPSSVGDGRCLSTVRTLFCRNGLGRVFWACWWLFWSCPLHQQKKVKVVSWSFNSWGMREWLHYSRGWYI